MRVVAILEGPGDLLAFPCLIARTGNLFGSQFISPNPIRSGGFHNLKRPGQLERFVSMAVERPEVDLVLIAVDLDDGCAKEEAASFNARIEAMNLPSAVAVRICFCVREYECWFLSDIDNLKQSAQEYEWNVGYYCNEPEQKRDAKGEVNKAISKHYKEIVDQIGLTRKLNLENLFKISRSYRKFVRCMTGLDYAELDELMA